MTQCNTIQYNIRLIQAQTDRYVDYNKLGYASVSSV